MSSSRNPFTVKCRCCGSRHVIEVMTGIFWCKLCHYSEYEPATAEATKHNLIDHVKNGCIHSKYRVVKKQQESGVL